LIEIAPPRQLSRSASLSMMTNLYVTYQPLTSSANISQLAAHLEIPGYSFSTTRQKETIHVPGEGDFPVTCFFYAHNHFRIYVSHHAVEFYREAEIPPELVASEALFYKRILETKEFSVRKWLATSEGWNDDDEPFVETLAEGNSADTFPLLNV
jgi:hypothetical protein